MVILCLILSLPCFSKTAFNPPLETESWQEYSKRIQIEKKQKMKEGMSYIISGTLELLGGVLAEANTLDPVEKGVYVLFESIGIASIGYGSYHYSVNSDEETLIESLKSVPNINDQTRLKIMKNYFINSEINRNKEDRIRALTHGLISILNFYNGSQQKNETVRNTIFFIGGINLLACISYSF